MKQMWLLTTVFLTIFLSVTLYAGKDGTKGGDMPFPIGKVIDLPLKESEGDLWKVPKIAKLIKVEYLEQPTLDGDLFVELLSYGELSVIADGVGKLGKDKILRAILKYKRVNRYVSVMMGSYCADPKPHDGKKSYSAKTCEDPRFVATFEPITGTLKGKKKAYDLRKPDETE